MNKILWLDLETTGLDPEYCHILEVAAIVTDEKLNELRTYHSVIFQPKWCLSMMDTWCKKTHAESGLLAESGVSQTGIRQAEWDLAALVRQEFPDPKARPILAGSSIHFDRAFIKSHMRALDRALHYRMIDVSSFKEALRICQGFELPSPDVKHRAMADIRGSIECFRQYMALFRPDEAITCPSQDLGPL